MFMDYNSTDIDVTDSLDGLQCHHFADSVADREHLYSFRGIIAADHTIFCKSFPFSIELPISDPLAKDRIVEITAEPHRIFDSYEGTLLRLWFDPREGYECWRLSTHRKIDAFTSYWGSNVSYGEYFTQALALEFGSDGHAFASFAEKLDKNKVYVLLLRTGKENRVICKAYSEVKLFSIGCFDRANEFAFSFDASETGLATVSIAELLDVEEYVKDLDPYQYQGIVIITESGKSLKILNDEYHRLNKLRNNNPNILKRYIELRKQESELSDYVKLYPDFQDKFEHFETVLQKVCNNVFKKYINRYVRNRVAILPREQYYIMTEVHCNYLTARENVKLEHVERVLEGQTSKQLLYIYNQFVEREGTLGDGNFVPKEEADRLFAQIKRT
jgi:hypothetical protein